jgi:HNH endonuclease
MKIDAKVWLHGRIAIRRRDYMPVYVSGHGPQELLVEPYEFPPCWEIQSRPAPGEAVPAWKERMEASPQFVALATEIFERQKTECIYLKQNLYAFNGRVYAVGDSAGLLDEEILLLVKREALSLSLKFKSMEREIKAFENLERLIHRDPIPESVRLYVWQRDQGQCIECHRRDGLEFDHIIPVSEGGSSTERNIQLLCLRCNRTKGAKV